MTARTSTAPQPVIVVGAGLGGLATAVAARELGHPVTVLEKSALVGGAAAYSGGQVWVAANHLQEREGIDDSRADGERYVRHLSRSHPELLDETAMHRWLTEAPRAARYFEDVGAVRWSIIPGYPDYYQDAPGAALTGRYLTAVHDARLLGAHRPLLRVSPHFPVGTTYDELLAAGLRASAFGAGGSGTPIPRGDLLSFGTGVLAGFYRAALDRGTQFRLEHEAVELIVADGRVAGVEARTPDGRLHRFDGAVVLATSGYDWDDELAAEHLGLQPGDRGSVAPTTLTGDGIRLARRAGGAVTAMPANRVPIQLGYPTEGYPGFAVAREHSLPHTFVVDAAGRRFADDAVYWEIVKAALVPGSTAMPCWMIWDSRHHAAYGLGTTPPGGEYPDGLVTSAPTLAELGNRLGIDGDELTRTAERFTAHVAQGTDPDFGRGTNLTWQKFQGDPEQPGNPNLGAVDTPPFHGMRLRMVSTGIGLSGVTVDPDGRVLDDAGDPVPGLYAAGAVAAFHSSGTGYNSGFSLSRALTLGLLVAESIGPDGR